MNRMTAHARTTDEQFAQYNAGPNPLGLFVPCLGGRQGGYVEIEQILAGQPHGPVVYFARIGRNIKIGTTQNLRSRMRQLYLDLDDILAVVPGGELVEGAYHQRFSGSQVEAEGRTELFRLSFWLWLFLARCRCSWAEALTALGVGAAIEVGAWSPVLALLACASILLAFFVRPGWDWR